MPPAVASPPCSSRSTARSSISPSRPAVSRTLEPIATKGATVDNEAGQSRDSEWGIAMKGETPVRKPSSRPHKLEAPLKSLPGAPRKGKASGSSLHRHVRAPEKRAQTPPGSETHRPAQPDPQVVTWAKTHFEANRELYEWLAKL